MIEFEKRDEVAEWLNSGSVNFYGKPTAGKDDQAERMARYFNGEVLSGGKIFRNSVIPPEVEEILHKGGIVPTEEFVRLVIPYLSHHDFHGRPLMLTSVGRMKGEEESVMAALDHSHHPLKLVVHLDIDDDTVRARSAKRYLQQQRRDDAPEAVELRLSEYEKTMEVIEHYRALGYVVDIDGHQSQEEVECQVLGAIALRAGISQSDLPFIRND